MIRAEQVGYSYNGAGQTVSDLTFHIEKGEFVAVIGENGAGKTTTVKLIDGLLKPTSGRMLVNGLDTAKTRVSDRAKQVGSSFRIPTGRSARTRCGRRSPSDSGPCGEKRRRPASTNG